MSNLSDDNYKYVPDAPILFGFSSAVFIGGIISCNAFLFRSRHSSFDMSNEYAKVTDNTALGKTTLGVMVSNLLTLHEWQGKTVLVSFT